MPIRKPITNKREQDYLLPALQILFFPRAAKYNPKYNA
jgi:hypothetical protein